MMIKSTYYMTKVWSNLCSTCCLPKSISFFISASAAFSWSALQATTLRPERTWPSSWWTRALQRWGTTVRTRSWRMHGRLPLLWGGDIDVRSITWHVDNPRALGAKLGGKPIPAIVEHVRDGSTVSFPPAWLLPHQTHNDRRKDPVHEVNKEKSFFLQIFCIFILILDWDPRDDRTPTSANITPWKPTTLQSLACSRGTWRSSSRAITTTTSSAPWSTPRETLPRDCWKWA